MAAGKHILVADDDGEYRAMLGRILESEGYRVSTASNGREAVRQQAADPADLLITDLAMPEQEGFETIMQFRQRWRKLPIIAMSGSGNLLPTALSFGAMDTLAKPFSPKTMLDAAARLLSDGEDQPPEINLLLLEDDEQIAKLLKTALKAFQRRRFQVTHHDRLEEGLRHLNTHLVDLILTDLGLVDSAGLDTFLTLQKHSPSIPIVVLTGNADEELGSRAVQQGAQEYLRKIDLDVRGLPMLLLHSIERKKVEHKLRQERMRSELLLQNLLPTGIARRFSEGKSVAARQFDEVSVLFSDLTGFTEMSSGLPPAELVELLNQIFSAFDQLAQGCGLEKIKTIGDAYMAAGGIPDPMENSAQATVELGQAILEEIVRFNQVSGTSLNVRVGIATGPVVAGVIGLDKIQYDLWGDTVNIASRMESHGEAGRIHICPATRARLEKDFYFEDRGLIEVKGKGPMNTYFVTGRRFG